MTEFCRIYLASMKVMELAQRHPQGSEKIKRRNIRVKVGEESYTFCVFWLSIAFVLRFCFILDRTWYFCAVDSSDEDVGDTEALLDELLGSGRKASHRRLALSTRVR